MKTSDVAYRRKDGHRVGLERATRRDGKHGAIPKHGATHTKRKRAKNLSPLQHLYGFIDGHFEKYRIRTSGHFQSGYRLKMKPSRNRITTSRKGEIPEIEFSCSNEKFKMAVRGEDVSPALEHVGA